MLTIINSTGPWDGDSARNALDMIMMAVSLDQEVQVLFMDDGVYQLLAQQANALETKNPLVKYRILVDIFAMESLYALDSSLTQRHLNHDELAINVETVNADRFNQLLQQSSKVVRF